LATKSFRGKEIIFSKPRPKSTYDHFGLEYHFIVLSCLCLVAWPYTVYLVLLLHDIACLYWRKAMIGQPLMPIFSPHFQIRPVVAELMILMEK